MPEPRHALGRVELSTRVSSEGRAPEALAPAGLRELGPFTAPGSEDVTEWGAPESPWARVYALDPPSEATTVHCTPAPVLRPALDALFGAPSASLDLEASRPIEAGSVERLTPIARAPVHEEAGGALVIEERGGLEIVVVLGDLIRNTGDVDPYARLVETSVDLVEAEPLPSASLQPPFDEQPVLLRPSVLPVRAPKVELDTHLAELAACFDEAAKSISEDFELPVVPTARARVFELDEAVAPSLDPDLSPTDRALRRKAHGAPRRASARASARAPVASREAILPLRIVAVSVPFRAPVGFRVRDEHPQPAVLPKTSEQALAAILDELAAPKKVPVARAHPASKRERAPSLLVALGVTAGALALSSIAGVVAARAGEWGDVAGSLARLVIFGAAAGLGLWLTRAPRATKAFPGLAPRVRPSLAAFAIGWGVIAGIGLVRLDHAAFPAGAAVLAAFTRVPSAAFFVSVAAIVVEVSFFRAFLGRALGRALAGGLAPVLLQTALWALFLLSWRTSAAGGFGSAVLLQLAASTALLGAPMAFFQQRTGRVLESVLVHVTAALITLVAVPG